MQKGWLHASIGSPGFLHNILSKTGTVYILGKDELQEWTVHSTLISENLKLVEISKNNPNTI